MGTRSETPESRWRAWWRTYGGVVAGVALVILGKLLSLSMQQAVMLIGFLVIVGLVYEWGKRRRAAVRTASRA